MFSYQQQKGDECLIKDSLSLYSIITMYEGKQTEQFDIDSWLDSTNPSEYQDEPYIFNMETPQHHYQYHLGQDLVGKFAESHIVYHPETYFQPYCHLVPSEHHQQVMLAFVKLGFFDITLQLLYQERVSKEKKEDVGGSFGSVSELELFDQTIVIKTIEIKDKEKRMKVISSAIKEYCCLKIASALGLAPKADNYLGFDMIIFENCVQFAMEKTPHIVNFTQESAQQLQESLQIFHRIHLIHFDIKPSNIAFSQHFNRAVFLDFGMSQVIKQGKGVKTLIKFRGSLAFCSEEMLKIFYDYEHKHLIDVYENDAVCLENAIQIINMIKVKRQDMIRLENQTIYSLDYGKIENPQCYLIDLAKYLLCNMKYRQFKILLNEHLRAHLTNIFAFLQEIHSNPHLQAFFSQEMTEFQHNDAYLLLEAKFKNKNRLWSSKGNNFDGQENMASVRETIQLSLDINQEKFDYSQSEIVRILQFPNTFPSSKIEIYFTLYLKATRFDSNISNIPLQTKIRYAQAFYHHTIKTESHPIHNLLIFRQNIQYLMRYALSTPLTRWKHQNIYFVLLQFVIFDCNFQPFFQQFKTKIITYYSNTQEEIMHLIQITKISKLLLLKHKSQFPLSHKILNEYLDGLYFSTLDKIISCQSSIGLQMRQFMKKLVAKDSQKYDYQTMVSLYQQDLWRIDSHILRDSLKKYIITTELYQRIANGNINCCFTYLKYMNPYFSSNIFLTNKHTLTFDLGFYEYIIIMKAINNTAELKHVAALFKNVFGFQEIYQNFKFQMIIDLSISNTSPSQLLLYAHQVVYSPLPILHESISAQFFVIWKKINEIPSLYKQQGPLIDLILEKIKVFFQQPKVTDISFQNAVNQSHILNQSIKFQKNKEQYIKHALQSVKQHSQKLQDKCLKDLLRMKYYIYAGYLYLSIDQYQKSYDSFEELLSIAFQLEHINLLSFCYINLFMTARILNKVKQQKEFLRLYCFICQKIREFKGYFTHKDMDLIFITLQTIDQIDRPEQIYIFLSDLSSFITLYPIEDYFNYWITSVAKFQQRHSHYFLSRQITLNFSHKLNWENAYLILYYVLSLSDCNTRNKQYCLLEIAQHLKAIKPFARTFILGIYYRHMLALICPHSRKSKFILLRESKHCKLTLSGKIFRKTIKSTLSNKRVVDQRHLRNMRERCKKINII